MCVILGSKDTVFRQRWMQDIVFLTPGGVNPDPDELGHRRVITTLAVECDEKADLYLTYAGEVGDFVDLHDTFVPEPDDPASWINAVTNYSVSGGKRLRDLRHDADSGTMRITFYDKARRYAPIDEISELKVHELSKWTTWPESVKSDSKLIKKVTGEAGLGIPFSTVILEGFPKGKSILRFAVTIRNRDEKVATDATVFDILGAEELTQEIGDSLEVLRLAPATTSVSDREIARAYAASSQVFARFTAYGPRYFGTYDAIVQSYPYAQSEQIDVGTERQEMLHEIKLPWANPRDPSKQIFMGMFHTASTRSFRLKMRVSPPPQICDSWQYPVDPFCNDHRVNENKPPRVPSFD